MSDDQKNYGEVINHPVVMEGKLFTGISAVIGQANGRWTCIIAHTVEDVRNVWDLIRENSPDVLPLNESMMQEVVIGSKAKIREVK